MSRNLTGCFATAKYRGGVRRTEGLNKIIRNRGNISKYQHPTSVHRRWDRGSARKARGLSLQKHNTLSFSILHRRDRNVAIVKNFIAKIHVYSLWFSTEPNTEPTCDKRRRRIRESLILLRLQVSFLFFIYSCEASPPHQNPVYEWGVIFRNSSFTDSETSSVSINSRMESALITVFVRVKAFKVSYGWG